MAPRFSVLPMVFLSVFLFSVAGCQGSSGNTASHDMSDFAKPALTDTGEVSSGLLGSTPREHVLEALYSECLAMDKDPEFRRENPEVKAIAVENYCVCTRDAVEKTLTNEQAKQHEAGIKPIPDAVLDNAADSCAYLLE